MNKRDRDYIGVCIMRELRDGSHTFTMCRCGKHGARSIRCWQCWLAILVRGDTKELDDVLGRNEK